MATNKFKIPNGSGGYKTVGSDANKVDLIAATPYYESTEVDGALVEVASQLADLMNWLEFMPVNGGDFDGSDPIGPILDGGTY